MEQAGAGKRGRESNESNSMDSLIKSFLNLGSNKRVKRRVPLVVPVSSRVLRSQVMIIDKPVAVKKAIVPKSVRSAKSASVVKSSDANKSKAEQLKKMLDAKKIDYTGKNLLLPEVRQKFHIMLKTSGTKGVKKADKKVSVRSVKPVKKSSPPKTPVKKASSSSSSLNRKFARMTIQ